MAGDSTAKRDAGHVAGSRRSHRRLALGAPEFQTAVDHAATCLPEVGRAGARDDGTLSPSFLKRDGVRAGSCRRRGRGRCSFASSSAARRTPSTSSFRTATRSTTRCVRTLRSRRPGSRSDGAIDLDGFFGLHPALAPLKPLWDRGMLAPVHAVGSPSSHALALRCAGLHGDPARPT